MLPTTSLTFSTLTKPQHTPAASSDLSGASTQPPSTQTAADSTRNPTPGSSSENLALLPSNVRNEQTTDERANEDPEKQVSRSKTKRKYLGLTSESWCYVWLAFCVVGGIIGGTMGAIYGKGTRYGGRNHNR